MTPFQPGWGLQQINLNAIDGSPFRFIDRLRDVLTPARIPREIRGASLYVVNCSASSPAAIELCRSHGRESETLAGI